ncbi:MAG: benzoate-CoA ligase family protein [Candidatus Eisenbacteria bacterium]
MTYEPPEQLNIADFFLDDRVREGRGGRIAVRTDSASFTFAEVQQLANRYANLLTGTGAEPEHRVLIALPDGPDYVGALFGALKLGAVVVMANPGLEGAEVKALLDYTRARVVVTHREGAANFLAAARDARHVKETLVVGGSDWSRCIASLSPVFENALTHRDDAAIWLFSGGTTGIPKAVVQTHRSFAYTTECYARDVIGYGEDDITLAVPKLYFGYATGSNLFFPFRAGASTVLFPEPATVDAVFDRIRRFRPTVLINVPTMINRMVSHPAAAEQDLSSLRLCTSAGEALPEELDRRWRDTFAVDLLDGLGTAEMWHIFISNRPGAAHPGTLGQVVPGFEVKVCGDDGAELPRGETGWLWVRGGARAIAYWRHQEKTERGFRGEWYVSGDLIRMDAEGYVTYHGRGDEMLKVAGKWLAPAEVEGCLLQHPAVSEAAVVGRHDASGLMKPVAYVVAHEQRPGLDEELRAFVRDRLDAYKHPREVHFVAALPRTHLGKVDRGLLRRGTGSGADRGA